MNVLARVGIIGDVHAEHHTLKLVIEALRGMNLDAILCTGDIVDGPGDPDICCGLLRDCVATTVSGNHERWFLEGTMRDLPEATPRDALDDASVAYLRTLPTMRRIDTIAGSLLLCHGVGRNDMRELKPDDYGYALHANKELQELLASREYRFMVGGHTHRRMVKRYGDLYVINAGTLFGPHQPCFLTIDFASRHVQFYDIDGVTVVPATTHDF